jgi:hypothetical protein
MTLLQRKRWFMSVVWLWLGTNNGGLKAIKVAVKD